MLISKEKMKHMHAVAEYMYDNAESYGLKPEDMYVLGLLHDVGCVHGQEGHAETGAGMLAHFMGSFGHYANTIAAHGMSPSEYMERTGSRDIPEDLMLLWEADMQIGPEGEFMGYGTRLADIGDRYGLHSNEYRNALQIIEFLQGKGRGVPAA